MLSSQYDYNIQPVEGGYFSQQKIYPVSGLGDSTNIITNNANTLILFELPSSQNAINLSKLDFNIKYTMPDDSNSTSGSLHVIKRDVPVINRCRLYTSSGREIFNLDKIANGWQYSMPERNKKFADEFVSQLYGCEALANEQAAIAPNGGSPRYEAATAVNDQSNAGDLIYYENYNLGELIGGPFALNKNIPTGTDTFFLEITLVQKNVKFLETNDADMGTFQATTSNIQVENIYLKYEIQEKPELNQMVMQALPLSLPYMNVTNQSYSTSNTSSHFVTVRMNRSQGTKLKAAYINFSPPDNKTAFAPATTGYNSTYGGIKFHNGSDVVNVNSVQLSIDGRQKEFLDYLTKDYLYKNHWFKGRDPGAYSEIALAASRKGVNHYSAMLENQHFIKIDLDEADAEDSGLEIMGGELILTYVVTTSTAISLNHNIYVVSQRELLIQNQGIDVLQ